MGKIFPAAGVLDKDIETASRFGRIISESVKSKSFSDLQEKLMQANAIFYKPGVVFVEKAGHKIFGIWAKFIRKKGGYNSEARSFRLSLFKYYLFAVLYLISPIGLSVFYLSYPLRIKKIKKEKRKYCYLDNE